MSTAYLSTATGMFGYHKGTEQTGAARVLARYVCDLDPGEFSDQTREAVLRCVFDLLSAAAAGLTGPGVAAARQSAVLLYGGGSASIWFTGQTASPLAAVMANSAAAAAHDLDDGYRRARGHPGAAVIPAALASLTTLSTAVTTHEFFAAIVAGYEVGVRMSMGRLSYAPSGAWSPYAVIATVGRLSHASDETLAQAFGIAAQTAPALPALAGIAGSDVKEGIPWGAVLGLAALEQARAGMTGPIEVFDDPRLFAGGRMTEGIGGEPLIVDTYFKPYGCCRHIHGALDALDHLQTTYQFKSQDISTITVHTYLATFNLSNLVRPSTLVQAQYSMPHCLAAYAIHGLKALLPLAEAHLHDCEVNALSERVHIQHDTKIEPLFPARSPSWIRVVLLDGTDHVSSLTDPRGDSSAPLSWPDLVNKFMLATRDGLSTTLQAGVIDAVKQLRQGSLDGLQTILRSGNE